MPALDAVLMNLHMPVQDGLVAEHDLLGAVTAGGRHAAGQLSGPRQGSLDLAAFGCWEKRRGTGRWMAPDRSPHQRRARPPLDVNLGSEIELTSSRA
jgi:hypothetical protein